MYVIKNIFSLFIRGLCYKLYSLGALSADAIRMSLDRDLYRLDYTLSGAHNLKVLSYELVAMNL